jgi:hypothetical protein
MLIFHKGKILQDSNTVESYKIEEKGFIVCMVSKVYLSRNFSDSVLTVQSLRRPPQPAPLQRKHLQHLPQQPQPPPLNLLLQLTRVRQQSLRHLPLPLPAPRLRLQRRPPRSSMTPPLLQSELNVLKQSQIWRAWVSQEHKLILLCERRFITRIELLNTF